MNVDAKEHKSCSVSYEGSYLFETFSDGKTRPKLTKCSRPVLKNGKCIIHSEKPDGPIDFVQQDAFDQALLDKVKTLGVPLVRAVDFTSYAPVFLNEFVMQSPKPRALGLRNLASVYFHRQCFGAAHPNPSASTTAITVQSAGCCTRVRRMERPKGSKFSVVCGSTPLKTLALRRNALLTEGL